MYSYITKELPALVNATFPVDGGRVGITGHSMGGHGALTIALRNPGMFKSVSAFAPICNPTKCPWGEKAFTGYLGSWPLARNMMRRNLCWHEDRSLDILTSSLTRAKL